MNSEPIIVACVAVESGLKQTLDYLVPPALAGHLTRGHLVEVPLRRHQEIGIVVDIKSSSDFTGKLRSINKILDNSISVPEDLLELAKWISHYYCASLRRVLQVMVPKSVREDQPTAAAPLFVTRAGTLDELAQASARLRAKHSSRSKILDVLLKVKTGILLSELLEKAQVSRSPLQSLEKEGLVKIQPLPDAHDQSLHQYFPSKSKTLVPEQLQALDSIQKSLDTHSCHIHLLFGVTGSGKTEVYLQAIDHVLKSDETGACLIMVPEVSLTPQTIDRIRSRFNCPMAILHYRLSPSQRHREWESIRQGEARIIIGARSSIFCPAPHLRLIIVDEEHEGSYKSEESPHYHARDVAIERAKRAGAVVILGSATPSLESYEKAVTGQYQMLKLHARANESLMPKVQVVDMIPEYEKSGGYTLFSSTLIDQLKACIERGEQAMLFLNRRGYFTHTQCSGCGETRSCPHCDVNLTYHKNELKLVCHLCHYNCPVAIKCPKCGRTGLLKFRGWGTEHVQASLHRWLPGVRTLRIDADTTRHKGSMEKLLREFRTHKADVLVGTQMIAKGHHFPGLTLVGVLNPDSQLLQPDFRASEQLFQLLVQVFGRSGRSHIPGHVIVQTGQVAAPIYRLASEQNYVAFAEQELQVRKLFSYPPYIHIIKVTLHGPTESQVIQAARELHADLLKQLPSSCMISSPGEGAWRKVQDSWRQVFLIKVREPRLASEVLNECRKRHENGHIAIHFDVDSLHIG